jgi:hypothetical protein
MELDATDRDFTIDRYTSPDDGDQIIRFLEGRCYACGK